MQFICQWTTQPFPFELLYFSMGKLNFQWKTLSQVCWIYALSSHFRSLSLPYWTTLPWAPWHSLVVTGCSVTAASHFSLRKFKSSCWHELGHWNTHSVQYRLLLHHSSSGVTNGLMEKVGKFKPTHLWHRLIPKERTQRWFQAHCVPGPAFSTIWDVYMEWWIRDLTCNVKHWHLHCILPKIQVYCSVLYPNTEKMPKQLLCSHARRKVVHFSSHTEPTGSRGLGWPDKLWARMWSLGAAPNPNVKSLLLAHHYFSLWWMTCHCLESHRGD